MPGIRFLSEFFGGVPVVTTPAEIDITTAEKLREVLCEATSNGYPMVAVDMTRTRFCDCAGLHILVRAHERVLAEGSGLRLAIPGDGAVPRILALTLIDRFIPCFASVDDALAQTPGRADPRPGACDLETDQPQADAALDGMG